MDQLTTDVPGFTNYILNNIMLQSPLHSSYYGHHRVNLAKPYESS